MEVDDAEKQFTLEELLDPTDRLGFWMRTRFLAENNDYFGQFWEYGYFVALPYS